jgi:glutamate racemase
MPAIERIVAGRAQVIDPAPAVARQVQRLLLQHKLASGQGCVASHRFYTTGEPELLEQLLTQLYQQRPPVMKLDFVY